MNDMGIVLSEVVKYNYSELYVPPSPCKSVQESTEEGGDQHPVILRPRRRDAWSGIEQRPPAKDQDQELYPITTDSLDNIDEGVPIVKD